jgi:hypothetical protein
MEKLLYQLHHKFENKEAIFYLILFSCLDMPPILVDGKMTSGEKRMLEWPGLTALHTLFLRSKYALIEKPAETLRLAFS